MTKEAAWIGWILSEPHKLKIMNIDEIRKNMLGKPIKYGEKQGVCSNVNEAKHPHILTNISNDNFGVTIPAQYDIEVTYLDGKRETIKNAQID